MVGRCDIAWGSRVYHLTAGPAGEEEDHPMVSSAEGTAPSASANLHGTGGAAGAAIGLISIFVVRVTSV